MMATSAGTILTNKLHRWKTSLIDMSKRNRLLNFKDNNSSVIQFNHSLNLMFDSLMDDRALRVNAIADLQKFIAKEKRARKKKRDAGEMDEELDFQDNDIEHFAVEKLENVLSKIRLKAKSSIDEKGVNTLFITFGMLNWKESKDSDIELKSPLVLLPVTLHRDSADQPYFLQKYDEDVTLNPTLSQKLRIDFGLQLPSIPDDEDYSISDVIENIKNYIKNFNGWEVTHESYLGLFSFSKLVMYKDFEQYGELIKQHDLVQKLAGIADIKHELANDSDDVSIREHDRKSKSVESFQVLDADSSQQEAILAANQGRSFIISGPPGTGKSQTITNIIAESLAKGKKVLFVSEKKAALEVVKRRLDSQNLGDFCLELHSNNANKKYVLEELNRTLTLRESPKYGNLQFEPFDKIKMLINNYVDALHTAIEPLGFTAQRIHGELAKLESIDELTFSVSTIQALTKDNFEDIMELLERLGHYAHVLKNIENHLWKGAVAKKFSFELQSDITAKFKKLAEELDAINDAFLTISLFLGCEWKTSPQSIKANNALSALFNHVPKVPLSWLKSQETLNHGATLYKKARELYGDFQNEKKKLFQR